MEKDASSGNNKLGIDTFGVSMTTLEEIFLQLGEEEDALKDEQDAKKSNVSVASRLNVFWIFYSSFLSCLGNNEWNCSSQDQRQKHQRQERPQGHLWLLIRVRPN
jgi:hypothetical protein